MKRRTTKIVNESETLAERRARRSTGSRGKSAESKVQELLTKWAGESRDFDFDRLLDSRSAGRIVAAQVSDFLLFYKGTSATLEVKEVKSGLRLSKGKYPQHGRMLRRSYTGCKGFVLVNAKDTELWWVMLAHKLPLGKPSWKFSEYGSSFNSAEDALIFISKVMLR